MPTIWTDEAIDAWEAKIQADNVDNNDDDYEPEMCECEQDWNCGLHAFKVGTWIETRYQ